MRDCDRQILIQKKALRTSLRQRLSEVWPDPSLTGAAIVRRLLDLLVSHPMSGRALAGFMPYGHEPAIDGFLSEWLLASGILYLPIFDAATGVYALSAVTDLSTQLMVGHHRIREPLPKLPRVHPPFGARQIHAWLVPGLAFTPCGQRLGQGAGYYDRLLNDAGGRKIGVCNDCQIVGELPQAPHDVRMDILVTESQVIECKRESPRAQKGSRSHVQF